MTKHSRSCRSHTDASSSSSSLRCSCGNRSCEMMEIVRLLTETTDNYLLLQASAQTLQQQVLPLLDELHQGHLSCLERWQIEWDIYQGQMNNSVRPSMRWQQGSAQEEALARKQQWAVGWYQEEQQRLQQRAQQIQEAMQRHEAHLEECALRFVLERPLLCCPSLQFLRHSRRGVARS